MLLEQIEGDAAVLDVARQAIGQGWQHVHGDPPASVQGGVQRRRSGRLRAIDCDVGIDPMRGDADAADQSATARGDHQCPCSRQIL